MRKSGVLMPISSLSSPWGIGTMGACATEFLQFLHAAGQSVWQVLPVGPTSYGDSPYQSPSSFAGNPYLIDLDILADQGLVDPELYQQMDWGDDPSQVDYGLMYRHRFKVLEVAVAELERVRPADLAAFCQEQAWWLDDYALFMALKREADGAAWSQWPDELRRRDARALARAQERLQAGVKLWRGIQFLFFEQWRALRVQAHDLGIEILGDLPIYVAEDSADIWANPQQFQLDENLQPVARAGCPPDGFSATGQLWGNPLFAWDRMEADGYAWWARRIGFQFELYDILRIDHFRGFESYFAIPVDAPDASCGHWCQGPGIAFFEAMRKQLGERAIIAEDLGFLTPSVAKMLADTGYPGMKVLEFAFDRRDQAGGRVYQPHNYPANCVAYVGTHDNDPAAGWFENADPRDVAFARDYLKLAQDEDQVWGMMRAIWASTANLTVVQAQDLLGLGSKARMNTPSTLGGNWCWRALPGAFTPQLATRMAHEMHLYERLPRQAEEAYGEEEQPGSSSTKTVER